MKNYDRLVAELKSTVADLAHEAQAGDEGARAWLVESFPGHVDFLLKSWRATRNVTRESVTTGFRRSGGLEK